MKVPVGYADTLYNLQIHIRFVRRMVSEGV